MKAPTLIASTFLITFDLACAQSSEVECDRFVSNAGGNQTVLQFQLDPNRADFTIRKGTNEEYWQFSGSVGTALAGTVYSLRNQQADTAGQVLYTVSLALDENASPTEERQILIFGDMAFWPDCK